MQSYRWTAELELAKNLTQEALEQLAKLKPSSMSLEMVPELPKEMKSEIDQISEDMILSKLLPTGLPVLSEESADSIPNLKAASGTFSNSRDGPSSIG